MAIHNVYDHALKTLAGTYPDSFLALTLPNLPVQLVGRQENVELALEIDRVDFLHEITIKGEPAYLHFDFELKHSSDFPRRVHVYNGMLTELKKPIPVISIPIYLKPREKEVPSVYEVKVGGHVFHRFTYHPILLWQHLDEIRSGKLYTLAPLLVLLNKNPTEETLIEERELILAHEPDPNRRRTLLRTAILIALAQNIFDSDFLWDFFKEQDMLLTDDPFFDKLFKERYGTEIAEAKAEAQAQVAEVKAQVAEAQAQVAEAHQHVRQMEVALHEAKTQAEAAQREAEIRAEVARREAEIKAEVSAKAKWLDTVSKFLTHRFANTPIKMVQDLQRISPEQHSEVINLALDAPDLATFEQKLKAMGSGKS